MSLTKFLLAPIKLFKKEVITFLIIRRYDLGIINENMRYIAVRPSASISVLRQKVWHLLDLPDYCEEVIILKSPGDEEIPLTELRRGNDPQHPYFLEVWQPGNRDTTTVLNNMIAYKSETSTATKWSTVNVLEENKEYTDQFLNSSQSTVSCDTIVFEKHNEPPSDLKKSNLSFKISKSSPIKLNGRRSQDKFTSLLLKIQNDLSTLSNKLSVLENKISA